MVQGNKSLSYICIRCLQAELPVDMLPDESPNPRENTNQERQPNDDNQTFNVNSSAIVKEKQFFMRKGLHIIHLNVRSLRNKVTEVRLLAQDMRASIIALSETWLDPYWMPRSTSQGITSREKTATPPVEGSASTSKKIWRSTQRTILKMNN